MKPVIITLGLFFAMKLIYGFWGDYYSDYWSVVYYLFNYLMMGTIFLYLYNRGRSVMERNFFLLAAVYFIALLLLHLVCLVKIELYSTLVSGAGYYGVGAVILTLGILYIRFKLKKPCRRNLDKKHSS